MADGVDSFFFFLYIENRENYINLMIKKTLTHKVILIYRKHVEIDLLLQTVARSVPKL